MYLEPGQCAQCGKKIADSSKYAPHNKDFQPGQTLYRPYFCSQKCVTAVSEEYMTEYWRKAIEDGPNRLKTLHQEAIDKVKLDRDYALRSVDNDEDIAKIRGFSRRDYGDQFSERRNDINEKFKSDLRRVESDDKERGEKEAPYLKSTMKTAYDLGRDQFHRAYFDAFPEAELARKLAAHAAYLDSLPPPVPDPVVPIIPDIAWNGHCLILAKSGYGKTNAIQWRIQKLLPQVAAGKVSLIIMEPKSVLIDAILDLPQSWEMRDRIVFIDPVDSPTSINIFDKGDGSEQALTDAISMAEYVISIFSTGITDLQRGPLTHILRLMFAIDGELSFDTLDDLLRNGAKNHKDALSKLSRPGQRFFQFDWDEVKSTASQLRARINTLLSDPKFERLLYPTKSSFNILDAMQSGKLILINADQDKLGEGHTTEMYGRFWLAQVFKASLRRYTLLRQHVPLIPTYFIIDEAQVFIKEDQRLRSILGQARQSEIGMMFAMHHMGDIEDQQIRDSIYTNTTLKFIAHTSADIHNLCRNMGKTEPDFITTLNQYEFAYFGPNMEKAIKVKLPLVNLNPNSRKPELKITDELLAAFFAKYKNITTDFLLEHWDEQYTPVVPEPDPQTRPPGELREFLVKRGQKPLISPSSPPVVISDYIPSSIPERNPQKISPPKAREPPTHEIPPKQPTPTRQAPRTRSMKIQANANGHVYISALINHTMVTTFVVDTGATSVALPLKTAALVGYTNLSFSGVGRTASGTARTAYVKLKSIRIGDDLEIRDVDAVILENLSECLLGQSFLQRLDSYDMGDGVLTLNWTSSPKPELELDDHE